MVDFDYSSLLHIVFGCASKSVQQRVTFAPIPKTQGVEHKELTKERTRLSPGLAITRDNIHSKRVLESEGVGSWCLL